VLIKPVAGKARFQTTLVLKPGVQHNRPRSLFTAKKVLEPSLFACRQRTLFIQECPVFYDTGHSI
jgi:hypothetical protein